MSNNFHVSCLPSALGVGQGGTQGCSGAGHGGGGGRGENQDYVGAAHGYYTQPSDYGQNGGYSVFPHMGGEGERNIWIFIGAHYDKTFCVF